MQYYVKLIYFKANGKFYSSGSYLSNYTELFQIWDEVRRFQEVGRLPGLVVGAFMPIISVKVPMHPHKHPHLVIDPEMRST